MSIAAQISRLQNDSAAIAAAIAAKGVTVPAGSGYDDYAALIGQISTGTDFDAWLKDGDTHLWIEITNEYQKDQQLRLRMTGTIDWGDGSTPESVSMSAADTITHTYATLGRYRIDLKPSSGTFYLGSASNSYCVMGAVNNRGNVIVSLYQVEIGTRRMTGISNYAFYYARGLRRVYVPKTITSIGTYAFGYCYSLRSVEFQDYTTITSVGTGVFYYDYSLQDISSYHPSVTTYNSTFRSCGALSEIILPSTLTTLSGYALNTIAGLKRLTCLPASPPSVGSNVFSTLPTACVIAVPFGSLSDYQAASGWDTYASQMVEAGEVTMSLTHVTSSNKAPMIDANSSYTTILTADTGYTLGTVTVTMGGVDITSTAYSNGVVSIASVTGNITITATAS